MRIGSKCATLFIAIFTTILWLSPTAKADQKKLRFICVTSLEEEQKVILASRVAEGKWKEHAELELRSSMITDWFPAPEGELHLAVKKNNTLESICQFSYPEDANRGLVFLIANPETKAFDAHFVDPKKSKFEKGSLLIFNLSSLKASVFFETVEHVVEAGQQLLTQPPSQNNGMYRMQVSTTNDKGGNQTYYDRYVSGNSKSRGMLFLLAEKESGLRVMSLPLLGDLE